MYANKKPGLWLPQMPNRMFSESEMFDALLPLLYDFALRLDKVRYVRNPSRLSKEAKRRLA